MDKFKEFWNNSFELNSAQSSTPSTLSSATQSSLSTIIAGRLALSRVQIFGADDREVKTKEFSNEVSSYATSDEVISELSNDISEPKKNETEEEFVARASLALREILSKKFNV